MAGFERSVLKYRAKRTISGNIGYLFVCVLIIWLLSFGLALASSFFIPQPEVVPPGGTLTGLSFLTAAGETSPELIIPREAWIATAISAVVSFLITAPLQVSFIAIIMRLYCDKRDRDYKYIFTGFRRNNYGRILLATLLMELIIGLSSLLLIFPGIIATYRYSQTYFLLLDNPEMSAVEALKESARLMRGRKADLFILHLSFIGWILLVPITYGIIIIYLLPYFAATSAAYYYALIDFDKREPAFTIDEDGNVV